MSASATEILIGWHDEEFRQQINEVNALAAAANDNLATVKADSERTRRTVRQVVRDSEAEIRRVLSQVRRVVGVMRGLFVIAGQALGESTAAFIESAVVMAETLLTLATANSLTVVGALRAAPQFALAISLFAKAVALRRQKADAARRFEGAVTLFSSMQGLY